MQPTNITLNPSLENKNDTELALKEMVAALSPLMQVEQSGLDIANTTTHYGAEIAKMEGFSRVLWGLFPLIHGGGNCEQWEFFIQGIRCGTDPNHPAYWGDISDYDQRCVEMAVYGLGLALLNKKLLSYFTSKEQENIYLWLNQSAEAEIPDNNWNYFPILVQVGFLKAGLPFNKDAVEKRFSSMEAYYIGNGWYSDGPDRPRDYYISMGFHYYGLLYAKMMEKEDPQRSQELRQRATLFAQDFIWMFARDGSAVPFGRSLSYRFAEAAFWSAAAFSDLNVLDKGTIKGLILRHLRWWMKRPIFDRDGILSIGYAYPNLIMAEDYNAPGSPYWAFKLFLILALPDSDAFWQEAEKPLPTMNGGHVIHEAAQILTHNDDSRHVWMTTSGQRELNNFVNTDAKYTKFAYSNRFGFTLDRGRYGLSHAGCDSALLLSECDGYYRSRRVCDAILTHDDFIYSRWQAWPDVSVETWLIPVNHWQVRVHHIINERHLEAIDGGFALKYRPLPKVKTEDDRVQITTDDDFCILRSFSRGSAADTVITPPNSHILFADRAIIPVLRTSLERGEHWLMSAIGAFPSEEYKSEINVRLEKHHLSITVNGENKIILLTVIK